MALNRQRIAQLTINAVTAPTTEVELVDLGETLLLRPLGQDAQVRMGAVAVDPETGQQRDMDLDDMATDVIYVVLKSAAVDEAGARLFGTQAEAAAFCAALSTPDFGRVLEACTRLMEQLPKAAEVADLGN